jgi:hypothetical protein
MNFFEAQSSLIKVLKKLFKFFPYEIDGHTAIPSRREYLRSISWLTCLILTYLISVVHFMMESGTYLNDDNPVTSMSLLIEASAIVLCPFFFLWPMIFNHNDQIEILNNLFRIEMDIARMPFT